MTEVSIQNLRSVSLNDKFEIEDGEIFLSGTQALARLPILQRRLDTLNGLNSSGFVSGYRGSPIGGLDQALWQIQQRLKDNHIVFQPGLNEELAATAVAGSQQINAVGGGRYDGVFGMWYGKGPGVDRAMDAFKHANFAGVHPSGGVLLAYGDDHPGKSSTVAHQSEHALAAQLIPSLYPDSLEEYFRYGLLGWAMSRFSGAYIGLKCVNETVEQTGTCKLDLSSIRPSIPELAPEYPDVHFRGSIANRLENERIALELRLPLVQQFVAKNGIDRRVLGSDKARLGIVASGKSCNEVRQALDWLGIDQTTADRHGISLYKVGCIWPLEPNGILEFADGVDEILVVEEKKPFLETQIASLIVNRANAPRLSGKLSPEGDMLFSSVDPLAAPMIAQVIVRRMKALGLAGDEVSGRATAIEENLKSKNRTSSGINRVPFFCSGCPHNTSTRIPEGSRGLVGTGCSTMEVFFRPDRLVPAQMGGEGANWIGLAPFTTTRHVFQNLGDGTYYHSGLLAIRAAIAAGVNITFKILYNDAVAMTGGQPVDGPLSVGAITHQVLHEGAARCVVVSDEPGKFDKESGLASDVDVYHRDELDTVQRELRDVPGCTVLIYEQTCAAEKRRRRKRGNWPNPARRLFINEAVCEGCGDCSAKSNCVSILPLETPFGRKRQIDQSGCNKDYSCAKGFCPSFVTVLDAEPKRSDALTIERDLLADIPEPQPVHMSSETYNIVLAGIGGTGVVTVASVLGMAAHLERRASSVFDMTGLAQKNGAVYSHLKLANKPDQIIGSAIADCAADLILGFDLIAATSGDSEKTINTKNTRIVGSLEVWPTANFQLQPQMESETPKVLARLNELIGEGNTNTIEAPLLAKTLLGDTIGTNFLLVGYALQLGLLPLSTEAVKRAIRLNGLAVESNLAALDIGRLAAVNPEYIAEIIEEANRGHVPRYENTEELIEHRAKHLRAYQNAAYADRYMSLVARVQEAEELAIPNKRQLTRAVAWNYAKLLAYKDEYEVARLYADPAFMKTIQAKFGPNPRLKFNLAPPILGMKNPVTGEPRKMEFGSWVMPIFKILSCFKGLRGTPFDIFGYNAERKLERKLITEYEAHVDFVLKTLTRASHDNAVALLSLPEDIRGFGPIKERSIKVAEDKAKSLLARMSEL